jgi:hypothetical protein
MVRLGIDVLLDNFYSKKLWRSIIFTCLLMTPSS